MKKTGGQIFVDTLIANGVDTVYCVPGESYLAILDALHDVSDQIRVITCRHEAAAANMAEAYGKLTGKLGVAMVTRGPGACHASIAIHCAMQSSTPVLLVVGQVARGHLGREAFQEVDYKAMFGTMTKFVDQIENADRVSEVLNRAVSCALSGRMGPVVLAVPEDMLEDEINSQIIKPASFSQPTVDQQQLVSLSAYLQAAKKPMMIIGGSGWSDQAYSDVKTFAERWNMPTCCSFRRQDIFDNTHPNYVGHLSVGADPALVERVKSSDLLLVVGARFDEISSQRYSIADVPNPKQTLIHVHADGNTLGRIYQPDLAINSNSSTFFAAACEMNAAPDKGAECWANAAREDYLQTLVSPTCKAQVDPGVICTYLCETLDENAIVTLDAGNFSIWPMRFLQWRSPRSQLGSQAGAMGCAVPLAVAASLLFPDRQVIGFAGDGGFMMSALELSTAIQYGGKPICLVFNNGMYGTIRMHQEREYPGRPIATDLSNPDFVNLARSMGCFAQRVEKTEEFPDALQNAFKSNTAAVIEVMVDPQTIKPGQTLSEISKNQ